MKSMLIALPLTLLVVMAGCASATSRAATPTPTPPAGYTLAGGGTCVRLGAKPTVPYANIQVGNDTFLDHSEPMFAENPQNPLNLVGGSKFFTDPAHYTFQIGTYASFDGGCTWTTGALLPGIPTGILISDVTFAFGPHNMVYASVLYKQRGVSVSASSDGGKNFGPPVQIVPQTTHIITDKPWIGVDQRNGAISEVWSHATIPCRGEANGSVCEEIAYARSTDGGQSFSAPRFIEGSSALCSNQAFAFLPAAFVHQCLFGIGATPVIGPDGRIAVTYLYLNPDTALSYQLVVTSKDDGQTWSNPVKIAQVDAPPPAFPGQKYRVASLPAFTGDPQTGQLYAAWADFAHGTSDIVLATSRDFGQTWSQPQRINDNPASTSVYDAQPQLAVASNGVVSIAFFDTRNDPKHHLIDEYLAQSVDHGANWLANQRITTQSWDPDVKAPLDSTQADGLEFIGDYQGLTADNLFVHPFWNDTRTGEQVIFTAAVPSALP